MHVCEEYSEIIYENRGCQNIRCRPGPRNQEPIKHFPVQLCFAKKYNSEPSHIPRPSCGILQPVALLRTKVADAR